MTLQAALVEGARAYPDRPWISCDGDTWSYAEGDQLTDRLARGLMAAGVEPGDRVALLFANSPELVFCYYACWKIGAIAVPLNIRFAPAELAYALEHCGAKLLLGQDQLCRAVMPLTPKLPHLGTVYVAGDILDGAGSFEGLHENGAAEPAALPPVADSQVAALLYTSGSTAKPKGVIHTHAGLLQHVENFFDALGPDVFERSVIALPLFHGSGFVGWLLPTTVAGGFSWIVRRYEPEGVLDAIQRSRATFCGGLPIHVQALLGHPGAADYDLSSVTVFLSGGDYVPGELQSRFKALFGLHLDEVLGMTELWYAIQPLRRGERRPGSVGKPIGDVEVVVLAPSGAPVPDGQVGEMVVRSAGMTSGYWNDPVSTAAAIRDGWLWTGDLGRRDADGYLWFEGRTKDVIIRGGSNIAPGEVEDVLLTHPAVAAAGVVGAPDPEFRQVVWAYVALRAGAEASEAELKAWAAARIAAYKVPARILFADQLPVGLTGKTDRKALRERAAAEQEMARTPT
jgi:acyl-CoA synthetase (AMP-forming)/AMP-acid ligase II